MSVKITQFEKNGKTHDILEISNEGMHFPFRIGKSKAKLIVENFEVIREFNESPVS